MGPSTTVLPKFNGKNYVSWAFMAKLVLMKKGVWDVVAPGDSRIKTEESVGENNWTTKYFPGDDHSERSWKGRLDFPLLFLLKK